MITNFNELRSEVDSIIHNIYNAPPADKEDETVAQMTASAVNVVGACLIQIAQELNEIKHILQLATNIEKVEE